MNNILSFIHDTNHYRDWRLPENRWEAFRRVAHVRMLEGDLDHHHTGNVIVSEMNLTKDQKALYCLLFGQSYRNHVAMIVLQQFPNLLDVKKETILEWHNDNWKRLKYAKDTKWGLRKLPDFIESIKHNIGDIGPYEYFEKFSNIGNKKENYYSLNNELLKLYGIGRMTAWLAQQTFYEFFNWNIDHWDLQLDKDTWSQWDSLCYLMNNENMARPYKPQKNDILFMENKVVELMEFVNDLPFHVDIYNIESCLCEFRKTMFPNGRKPKEFTFWTSSELAMEYGSLKDLWKEINWDPYVIGLCTKGKHSSNFYYSPEYFRVGVDYGMNLNTHYYYDDEPDAYKILSLPKIQTESVSILLNDWNKIGNDYLRDKYNPQNYLRWK